MLKSVNKVIKFLISSDLVLNSGWGLISPIFAIFIIERIQGGDVKVAGIAAAIYWIVKSSLQLPIGRYLDKNHGEKDDFYCMFIGTFLAGLVPFGFLFAFLPWHIYFLQFLFGVSMAMAIPSWSAIFSRHLDRGQEAFEWGLESTALGMGAGIAAALGGILVATIGFEIIFILVGVLTILSSFLLIFIYTEEEKAVRLEKSRPSIPPFRTPL